MGRAALADALSCRPLRECTNSSGVPMIRFAAGVVAVLATAGVLAGPASAAAKQLWYDPNVDAVASDIAGTAVNVHGEDDLNEWGSFVTPDDPNTVLGFTFPFEPSSSVLFHQIFIAPVLWPALRGAVESGPLSSGSNIYTTAVAIFDVTHEALHIRLVSGDENRVNACALQIFPAVLTRDFHISATDTKKTTVPVTKTVRVKYRVWVHRRWVTRYRSNAVTTYTTTTTTTPDATYAALVAAAQDFYKRQPASYNTGTCT